MRLFFIRHGETTGDVEDRYGGDYDDELSPEGEKQVIELAKELQNKGIQKVFSSSLKRAQQTAKVLAESVGCDVISLDGLRERNQYGPLTGMTKNDAKKQYPDFVELVKDRLNTLPNAESYAEASQRMAVAYYNVLRETDECSAVVWHGGGMRTLFRDILKLGELKKIGDCSWVEFYRKAMDSDFELLNSRRIQRRD